MQKELIDRQKKPWWKEYLLDPLVDIASGVSMGALGEAISPAKAAATAASKATTRAADASTKIATEKFGQTELTGTVEGMKARGLSDAQIGEQLKGMKDQSMYTRWSRGRRR
tara:strand:+ start:6253 stop:6588 length:336 start_codon:yes stop_codon:yes gene_type:complete